MANKILPALIVILIIFWILNVILSALAGATEDIIFKHKIGDVSADHTIQVTPKDYTFMIWYLIYAWVLIGYVFLMVETFRSIRVNVFTIPITGVYILNCALFTSWLFVWDNYLMTASSAILLSIMGTNWIGLGLFCYNLHENTQILQEESPVVLNCYRFLLLNSLGVYAAWSTIAALINFGIALVYDGELEDAKSSIIVLGILSTILTIWIPLDAFFLDKFCRYMLTPLFVVLWGLFGIFFRLEKVEYEDETPKHFTIGLIGVVTVLLIGRVTLAIFLAIKLPLTK